MQKEVMDLRNELGQYDWLHEKLIEERKNAIGMLSQRPTKYHGMPEIMANNRLKSMEVKYLEDGVNHLNDVIDNIRNLCGNEAADTIVRVYCHKEGVENVARDLGFSRRALEMKLSFWLAHVVEGKKIDVSVETPWTFDSKSFREECRKQKEKEKKE